MNPIVPEQRSATTSRLTHSAAGNAPNPFGLTMPTIHVSNASVQHTSSAIKENDSTVAGRSITKVIMRLVQVTVVSRRLHLEPQIVVASFSRPAKMNTDNHPLRDESDHEKVEHDKRAKCYRHDSDDLHSKENTPAVRCLTVESRPLRSLRGFERNRDVATAGGIQFAAVANSLCRTNTKAPAGPRHLIQGDYV